MKTRHFSRRSAAILRPVALLFACAAWAATSSAAPIYTWDFQDSPYVAGSTPEGAGVSTGGLTSGNVVNVVDRETTPVDPFGGDDNKSVYIHKDKGSGSNVPAFQLELPGYSSSSPLVSGTVTFDIYVEELQDGRGSLEIDLGTLGSTSVNSRNSSFAAFQINTSTATGPGSILYFSNTTSGGSITSSGYAMPTNAKNTIAVSWDVETKTYTISLNGTQILSSDFTVSSIGGLSAIRFVKVSDNSLTDLNFYVDNIAVTTIPEPGTVGLAFLAVGICGVALRKGDDTTQVKIP